MGVVGPAAITGALHIAAIASAPVARAKSLVPRIVKIPPGNVCVRGQKRSARGATLAGENDAAMNEIFRDDQFRVTRMLLFDAGLNWSARSFEWELIDAAPIL